MPFDYVFVQELSNFGQELAANIVGQPFAQYRLNPQSNGDVIIPANIINPDIRVKISHSRDLKLIENEYLHTNVFQCIVSLEAVSVGDFLVQNDPVYGGDTTYAVGSKRPLKRVMIVRTESTCRLFRTNGNRDKSAYRGSTLAGDNPWCLVDGQFVLGQPGDAAAVIPCGVQSIAQIKSLKATRLPMDNTMSYWYVYVPSLPGLAHMRENDIIEQTYSDQEVPVRYRVSVPYASEVGLAGHFLLCERVTP